MKYLKVARVSLGFTLIEVLITLAISGVIMTGVYTAFKSQQDSYLAQEQVAEMQQNIRAGLDMMVRDVRMAGFDPEGSAGAGITTASAGQLSFTKDLNSDGDTGDTNEAVDYGFTPAMSNPNYDVGRDGIPDVDSDSDGVPDAMPLGRQIGGAGGYQRIAENIQAIEFNYLDEGGNVTAVLNDIRSVEISILARTRRPDRNYTHNQFYCPASHSSFNSSTNLCEDPDDSTNTMPPWGPFDDNFRRRFQTMTVQCRNMGL